MTLLVLSVAIVLFVSALCSLTEAAIYAVRVPFIRTLSESGNTAGVVLMRFKKNMERPIAGILIINTVANTAGAAIAGAQARAVLGERWMIWFSLTITGCVLIFSEIIPKIVGVLYSERIAMAAAIPLRIIITALSPIIWMVEALSRRLKPEGPVIAAPEEEVAQLARMSAEEGSILPIEAELVQNVLKVDQIRAGQIMTPLSEVFRLPAGISIRETADQVIRCPHSRIPIFDPDHPDEWVGMVLQRDILAAWVRGQYDATLHSICSPIFFVDRSTRGHQLLRAFIQRKTHLFAVTDEFGQVIGVVTLEDVIESLIGQEIFDEVDVAVDTRELARRREQTVKHEAASKSTDTAADSQASDEPTDPASTKSRGRS